MEYFEESGLDYNALLESIRQKYGQHIHIMNRKKVMLGGILGFGKREGWCVTGYVSDSVFQPRTPETVPETLISLPLISSGSPLCWKSLPTRRALRAGAM